MAMDDTHGSVCMMRGCSEYDMLPARCGKCGRVFCTTHISYEAHQCTYHVDKEVPHCPMCMQVVPIPKGRSVDRVIAEHIDAGCQRIAKADEGFQYTNVCTASGCGKREHARIVCDRCRRVFCLEHRHPDQHSCPLQSPQPSPSDLAPKKQQPKTYARIRDIPFKNKATNPIGKGSHTDGSTLTLAVYYPLASRAAPRYMHFPKRWVAGRVLDAILSDADIRNPNNTVTDEGERMNLFLLQNAMAIPPSTPLEDVAGPGAAVMAHVGTDLPDEVIAEVSDEKAARAAKKRASEAPPAQPQPQAPRQQTPQPQPRPAPPKPNSRGDDMGKRQNSGSSCDIS